MLVLPLLLLALFATYIALDSPPWLKFSASREIGPSPSDLMLAEQRSLALLQQQAEGLLRLWNVTSNSSDGDAFRGEILSQIRLNKEAQQVLLSPHHNVSKRGSSFWGFGAGNTDGCRPVETEKYKVKKGLAWQPKPHKYLFAVCNSGQFSNHLICIEKHIFIAALLGRTLILPSPSVDYNYERVLNISHMQNCLGGNDTVITFKEFSSRHGHVHVDRFLCYMHGCYLDEHHEEKLKQLGVSWGKKEDVWPEEAHVAIPSHPRASEIVEKFTCDDKVIGIGDVFYADVEADWVKQPGGPLVHTCKSIIQPHNFILATAERFIQTYLGKHFLALHFRRYGFLTFCNENSKKGYKCFFYPIPQAAECILRNIHSSSVPVIYLSTDAKESETSLLQSLLVQNGVSIPLVQRPDHEKGEKWDSPLERHGLLDDKEVVAMLDKTICAMSSMFIGSPGSTFSADIMRMRGEWGTSNTCDGYLCEGEKPNFVATLT